MEEAVCDAFEEIDESIVKIESLESEQSFESDSLQVNLVPMTQEYNTILPKHRSRHSKKSLDCIKSQTSAMPKLNYSTVDVKLGFRNRFRPIRPKPLPPGASILRHKSFGTPSMMPSVTSNRIVVTMPSKDKVRYAAPSDGSNKTNNYVKPNNSNIGSTIPVTKENKVDKNITENSNMANSNNNSNSKNNNSPRKVKTISHKDNIEMSASHKGSIELFFESMAQTVLNLPREVQADIKMQICKIVTMAEMKYCGSQVNCKTE